MIITLAPVQPSAGERSAGGQEAFGEGQGAGEGRNGKEAAGESGKAEAGKFFATINCELHLKLKLELSKKLRQCTYNMYSISHTQDVCKLALTIGTYIHIYRYMYMY
jgi:hypothetical protein